MILTEEEIKEIQEKPFSQNDWLWFYTRAIEQSILDKLQDKLKNAERYEWIRNNTKECPVNPKAFNSDFPDISLRFDFPVLVSYDCVGNNITLDKAIDSAIAK